MRRVTLDDLFPRARRGGDSEPIEGVFRGGDAGRCWVCGRRTFWASLSFEAFVCSMVCDDIGWTRYRRGSRVGPVVEPFTRADPV